MTARHHMAVSYAALLACCLTPAVGLAETAVRFVQSEPILVTATPASDAGRREPCPDGLTPHSLPLSLDLAQHGSIQMPVELRAARGQRGAPRASQPVTPPPNYLLGKADTDPPLRVEGEVMACGFRRQLMLVGGVLRVTGTIGAWSVTEGAEAEYRAESWTGQAEQSFRARLSGKPKHTYYTNNIDQTAIWGGQRVQFVVVQPKIHNDSGAAQLPGDILIEMYLLVAGQ
jgi:hypothetical protein